MQRQAADPIRGLIRIGAAALVAGGVLAGLINAILTPLLPADEGSVAVNTSTAFGIRMPIAAAVVVLLTLGCLGLYLRHADRLRFGALAFLIAGIGGMMAFGVESVQFTLVRDLAFAAPEMLEKLEDAGELRRYDLAFGIGAGTFAVGWLAVAILTMRLKVLPRRGPLTLLAGMFVVPILGGAGGLWGAAIGNLVLGGGWALLGVDLGRSVVPEGS